MDIMFKIVSKLGANSLLWILRIVDGFYFDIQFYSEM